jgi:hypothetical protein
VGVGVADEEIAHVARGLPAVDHTAGADFDLGTTLAH